MLRLCAFTAASIALHALLLAAYTPRGNGGIAPDDRAGRVIHAEIAVAASPSIAAAEPEPMRPLGVNASSSAVELPSPPMQTASRKKGSDLPLPDKWYTATELEVLAQPLAPAKLIYPEEHISQAIITRVRVRLFVDEFGVVRRLEVVESGVESAFEAAAKKAWEGMRFSPAVKDGVAVKSQKLLELEFLPF